MEPFIRHSGIAVPLNKSDVDTDQIIPARFVVGVTRTGYEDALMHDWRKDPDFVLNDDRYRNGSILVAGPDFGTGSSRESAVWALMNFGFRVVLAPRFGDIFRGNATNNGLVTASITQTDAEALWESVTIEPSKPTTVDLESMTATHDHLTCPIAIADHDRWRLMNGYDDIQLTLLESEHIDSYERSRRMSMPAFDHRRTPA